MHSGQGCCFMHSTMIKLRWQVPSISATGVSEKRGWDAFHGGL